MRLLEVVGEAMAAVSAQTRQAHPDLPWKEASATRNRLIHGYFDIDLDLVWSTVTHDLPDLVAALEAIVERPAPS